MTGVDTLKISAELDGPAVSDRERRPGGARLLTGGIDGSAV